MPEITVASRYAEAMIDVAEEQNAVDQVGADLKGFAGLLDAGDGLLRRTLCTPLFSQDERTAVLGAVLPKLGLHPLSANFLHVISGKGRMAAIDDIARVYGELADARSGRVTVRVTTAEPMSDAIAAEVRDALSRATGKTVVLAPDVDPRLIGGMVARVGGKVYDSSIRTRLDEVKRALLSARPAGDA